MWQDPDEPQPFITCTFRSVDEQNELYTHGRNGDTRPKITNAKGGQSLHNFLPSFSFDIAFVTGKDGKVDWSEHLFRKFAEIFCRDPNLDWGGNWKKFKDLPHFGFKDFSWQDAAAARQPNIQFA